MSAPPPEIFPHQMDYDTYAADDEEIWATAMKAEDGTVAAYPPTPVLEYSGIQRAGRDDQVPGSEGRQPTEHWEFSLVQRPYAKDYFLVQAKKAGVPYSAIGARVTLPRRGRSCEGASDPHVFDTTLSTQASQGQRSGKCFKDYRLMLVLLQSIHNRARYSKTQLSSMPYNSSATQPSDGANTTRLNLKSPPPASSSRRRNCRTPSSNARWLRTSSSSLKTPRSIGPFRRPSSSQRWFVFDLTKHT